MKKILVIDDNQDMHVLIENLLEENDFEFGFAFDGKDGYNKIISFGPDLIVLDVQMPEMDGFELFTKLMQEKKVDGVPVIFLTGIAEKRGVHFQEKDVQEFYKTQKVFYLEKPLNPDKFEKLVKSQI